MKQLSAQLVPVLKHFVFSISTFPFRTLSLGIVVILILFLGAWARVPHFIEQG